MLGSRGYGIHGQLQAHGMHGWNEVTEFSDIIMDTLFTRATPGTPASVK